MGDSLKYSVTICGEPLSKSAPVLFESVRKQMMLAMKQYIELAVSLNTQVIIGCVRGNIPQQGNRALYWKRFDDSILELADFAAPLGVDLVVEAINSYVNKSSKLVVNWVGVLEKMPVISRLPGYKRQRRRVKMIALIEKEVEEFFAPCASARLIRSHPFDRFLSYLILLRPVRYFFFSTIQTRPLCSIIAVEWLLCLAF